MTERENMEAGLGEEKNYLVQSQDTNDVSWW